MTQKNWHDYLKLLQALSRTLGQLSKVERDKNDAVSRGDLGGVEECMKREQALSLALRGHDQKRDALLSAMGLKNVPLRGLEDQAPQELRLETKQTVEELRRQYEIFQTASKAARNTLECNLHAIEQMQAAQTGDSAQAEEQRKNHQTDFRA